MASKLQKKSKATKMGHAKAGQSDVNFGRIGVHYVVCVWPSWNMHFLDVHFVLCQFSGLGAGGPLSPCLLNPPLLRQQVH